MVKLFRNGTCGDVRNWKCGTDSMLCDGDDSSVN